MDVFDIIKKISHSSILPALYTKEDRNYLDNKWKNRNPNLFDSKCLTQADENLDFSLIIPLYNSEKYIDSLLSALIGQETKFSYEIILVDDGSRDRTLSIIRNYENKFSPLIHVISKKNGGISNARNSGLMASRGKYIGFMDHDDMVDNNYIQELMSTAYDRHADLVKCEIVAKNSYGSILEDIQTQSEIVTVDDVQKLMMYDGYIWACAISRKLFSHLRFPDSYWYEDMITRFLVYPLCNRIVNTTKTKYIKLEHDSNASKTLWSSKNYKALEQLYLLEHIFNSFVDFKVNNGLFIAKALLAEAGGTSEYRVDKLDGMAKKQVFLALRNIILENINVDKYSLLSEEEKIVYDIFKHKRYLNWLLLKFI